MRAVTNPVRAGARRAGGAALLTSLMVMIAVLIVAMSAAHTALNAEKAARNGRDRHIAFQAAEAALLDAEHDIEGGANPASARAALFGAGSALGFDDGCGQGADSPNLGLCAPAPRPLAPAWQLADLAGADAGVTVPYGRFTGALLPAGAGALPARPPRYLIELVPLASAGEDAGRRAGNFYRVTAIGFGAHDGTRVVLQSYYRKVAPAGAGAL